MKVLQFCCAAVLQSIKPAERQHRNTVGLTLTMETRHACLPAGRDTVTLLNIERRITGHGEAGSCEGC